MWRYLTVPVSAVLLSAGTVEAQSSIGVTAVIIEPFRSPSEVQIEVVRGELRALDPTPSTDSRILITTHFAGESSAPVVRAAGAVGGGEARVPAEWLSAAGETDPMWPLRSAAGVVGRDLGAESPRVVVTRVYASNS